MLAYRQRCTCILALFKVNLWLPVQMLLYACDESIWQHRFPFCNHVHFFSLSFYLTEKDTSSFGRATTDLTVHAISAFELDYHPPPHPVWAKDWQAQPTPNTHPSPNLGKSTWTGALQATIPAVPPPLQQASPSPTPMESHCCAAKIPVVRVFLTLAGPRQTHGNKCRIDRNRVRSSFLHTCHFQEPSCRLKASVF